LHKQKQNGNHQRRSTVDKSLASTEKLRFKEVISWISNQSVWTDTNGVHYVGNLLFQC